MNEALKKDLCARLPYGLKVKDKNSVIGVLSSITTHESFECVNIIYPNGNDFCFDSTISPIKPILFPISCLTKEITVNGETFVPIEKMFEMVARYTFSSDNGHVDFENENILISTYSDKLEFDTNEKCFSFQSLSPDDVNVWYPSFNQSELFDKLNEWHINYRLDKDQFIEATNEYE